MPPSPQIFTAPVNGAGYLLRGLKMLGRPGLRHFVWIPLLGNLALYTLGAWVGAHYFSAALHWLIPGWLEWLRWLLWPLFAVVLFTVAFFSFALLANLIASPFYGLMAQKAQQMLGIPVPEQAGRGALAECLGAARRLGYFAVRAVPLGLLSLIPGLNLASPFLWALFGAWCLSMEYLSYPLEAQGILFAEQRQGLKTYRLETLTFGGTIMLGLGIPLLNILVPPAAVLGATLFCAEHDGLAVRGKQAFGQH